MACPRRGQQLHIQAVHPRVNPGCRFHRSQAPLLPSHRTRAPKTPRAAHLHFCISISPRCCGNHGTAADTHSTQGCSFPFPFFPFISFSGLLSAFGTITVAKSNFFTQERKETQRFVSLDSQVPVQSSHRERSEYMQLPSIYLLGWTAPAWGHDSRLQFPGKSTSEGSLQHRQPNPTPERGSLAVVTSK